jgi:hypothetical protein
LQLFACINPPYISASSKMNPLGSLHTGHFNMLLYEGLPGFMGRVHALSFLAKAETGDHLNTPSLIQDKVSSKIRSMVYRCSKGDRTMMAAVGMLKPWV